MFVTVATAQLSAVTGVPRTTPVAEQPLLVVAVTSAGAVIVGAVLSFTTTVWVAVDEFPLLSVKVQTTANVP